MDLVSFESQAEQDFVGRTMKKANVREVWSSGRLCDKEVDGCEADRYSTASLGSLTFGKHNTW